MSQNAVCLLQWDHEPGRRAKRADGRSFGGGQSARRPGPEIAGSEKNEDLYVFTLRHVTLKKGQRMVVPVKSFDLKYEDVFTVDIGFAPPPEVWRNFNYQQQAEIAKLFAAPKAMHKLRLANTSKLPITTAPALILNGTQVSGRA